MLLLSIPFQLDLDWGLEIFLDENTPTMNEEDSLPSKCYLCDKEMVADGLSVLQKCSCLVTLCHTCALKQLIDRSGTYNSYLQCLVCGTHTEANSGLFMNLDLVESCENLLIDRAFVACGTNKPRKTSQNCQRYLPLLEKYANMGLEKFAVNINTSDLSILRLHIARMEWLRGGKPEEMADPFLGEDEQDIDDADELPMGPLAYLRFSHNLILEKIVALPETCEELDLNCNTCGCTLTPGSSTLSGCSCVSLVCSPCAPKTVLQNRETYKEGYKCTTCRNFYKVTFEGYDLVDAAISDMMIGALQAYCHKAGKKYKYKTFKDYALLIDDYWNAQYVPPTYYLDATVASTEQLRLEVARLEEYRRLKLRNSPDFKPEVLPDGPLVFLKCNTNPFLEVYIRHTKLEPEMDLADVDWSKYQYNVKTADEFRAMQSEQQNLAKDGINTKANEAGDENDPFRFLPLFRRQPTPCKHPGCTVNPYSTSYLSKHMKVIHGVYDKTIAQQPSQRSSQPSANSTATTQPVGLILPKIRKQPEDFPWHAEEPKIREVSLPPSTEELLNSSSLTPKRQAKSKQEGAIEDDLISLESDQEEDNDDQPVLSSVKITSNASESSNITSVPLANVLPPPPSPAQPKPMAIRNMDILSDDSSEDEVFQPKINAPNNNVIKRNLAEDPGILNIDSDTDEDDTEDKRVNEKESEPIRFIGVIGHKPEGSSAIGSSFAIAPLARRAPPPPPSGDTDKGSYFKILEGIKFAEQYEIIVELPKQRNSIFDCDVGKFGSFRLNYQIVLAKPDQKLALDMKGIEKSEINGVIELFTNKTQLSTIKAALTTQVGFNAIIVKIRTADGRVLQSTRSLSYYHLKDNSTVKILPMEVEVKRPVRPMVYHRKKASRPTHYELALKYAEQRRLRLEQEKAEMDRLTQKHHAPQTKVQPVVPLPMASGIEAAESKEDDDEIRRPVEDLPRFRPPMNSYERALMESDSESEAERRRKNKQQPPRPILGHFKRGREPEKPAPAPSQPLFKSKATVEIPVVKLQPREIDPAQLPADVNPWNRNSSGTAPNAAGIPPPPPPSSVPATSNSRTLTSYERALMEDSEDSDDSDYKRKKKKAANQPKVKAGAPLARYNPAPVQASSSRNVSSGSSQSYRQTNNYSSYSDSSNSYRPAANNSRSTRPSSTSTSSTAKVTAKASDISTAHVSQTSAPLPPAPAPATATATATATTPAPTASATITTETPSSHTSCYNSSGYSESQYYNYNQQYDQSSSYDQRQSYNNYQYNSYDQYNQYYNYYGDGYQNSYGNHQSSSQYSQDYGGYNYSHAPASSSSSSSSSSNANNHHAANDAAWNTRQGDPK